MVLPFFIEHLLELFHVLLPLKGVLSLVANCVEHASLDQYLILLVVLDCSAENGRQGELHAHVTLHNELILQVIEHQIGQGNSPIHDEK